MIKVTVPPGAPREIRAGDGRIFHTQAVYLHLFDRDGKPMLYPEKTDVFLDTDKLTGNPKPYAPGEYQLHPSSIYLDAKRRIAVAPRFAQIQR
jgi:hypothetical protein